MTALVAVIVTVAVVAVLVALRLPWASLHAGRGAPVRFNFLLVLGVAGLAAILAVFWFAMKAK